MYEYNAVVTKVHDGDTITVDIDLGFHVWTKSVTLRLMGINAPELATPEGKQSQAWLAAQLPLGTALTVQTYKDATEKYGRYLATLWLIQGDVHRNLNSELVSNGYAVPYSGGQRNVAVNP